MKSGSLSRTFSEEGRFSAMRGTLALAFSRPFITGSVQVEVPASRSARPSESRISVDPWSRETAWCGAAPTVTVRPQFFSVTG